MLKTPDYVVVGRIYEFACKEIANRKRRSTSQVYEIPSFPSVPARALVEGPVKRFHQNPFILLMETLLRSDAYCRCRGSLGCLSEKVGSWGYPTSSLSSRLGILMPHALRSETDPEDQQTQTQKDNSFLKSRGKNALNITRYPDNSRFLPEM